MTFNLFSVLERPALLPTRYTTAIKFQTRKQPSLFVILPSLLHPLCYFFTAFSLDILAWILFQSHSNSLCFLHCVNLLYHVFTAFSLNILAWILYQNHSNSLCFTALICYTMCSQHLVQLRYFSLDIFPKSHSYSLHFLHYVDLLVLFLSWHLIWIF